MNTEQLTKFEFGDYALIEQKRHGYENEMFDYKVVGQLRSNSWVDVPVQVPATETLHSSIEDVCLCICLGIDETEVKRFLVKDMKPCSSNNNGLEQALSEANGKVLALAAENSEMWKILNAVTDLDNEPQYHEEGMGCGIEDRGYQRDGYRGCQYGWYAAMERIYSEVIPCAEDLSFPATSAAVAQIEAQGVDKAIAHLTNKFSDTGHIGVPVIALEWLAKELREAK